MTDKQKKILEAIKNKALSPKQIKAKTGFDHVRKTIRTLEAKGLVQAEGIYNDVKYKAKL